MFQDRTQAAKLLANQLSFYNKTNALVLAIPRGGIPMGKIIANALHAELDVVLVHKLGHPDNEEYAVGAIDEEGNIFLSGQIRHDQDLAERIEAIKQHQLARLKNLRKRYTPLKKRIVTTGRIVIIVDDGVATGWTAKAAISALRREKAKQIVVAVPVGARDSIAELKALADEVVCLDIPNRFQAVGQFYRDFSQVTDDEVTQILSL